MSSFCRLIGLFILFSATTLLAQKENVESSWEYRAVPIHPSDSEKNTKLLNDLAAEGWEYVGPLNANQVAFRKAKILKIEPKLTGTLEGHNSIVTMVTYSPDGKLLASCCEEGLIFLWERKTGKKVQEFVSHVQGTLLVQFSPDGKTLVSCSRDHSVILWDVTNAKRLKTIDEDNTTVSAAVFSPDGKHFATANDSGGISLRDSEGKLKHSLEGHQRQGIGATFSADGKKLITCGGNWGDPGTNGELFVWDWKEKSQVWSKAVDIPAIWSVSLSPDGKTLAGAGLDGTVRRWEFDSGKELPVLKGHTDRVLWVAHSPDGRILGSASMDGTVRIWSSVSGKELAVIRHDVPIQRFSFSPDGKEISVACSDAKIRVWQLGR